MALTKRRAWIYLFCAIAFELVGTTTLKLSDGFSDLRFTFIFAVAYTICFIFFTKSLQVLPLGLSYGIWGGIGTVGTVMIGIAIWNDPMSLTIALGIALVIAGTILMNMGTDTQEPVEEDAA